MTLNLDFLDVIMNMSNLSQLYYDFHIHHLKPKIFSGLPIRVSNTRNYVTVVRLSGALLITLTSTFHDKANYAWKFQHILRYYNEVKYQIPPPTKTTP